MKLEIYKTYGPDRHGTPTWILGIEDAETETVLARLICRDEDDADFNVGQLQVLFAHLAGQPDLGTLGTGSEN